MQTDYQSYLSYIDSYWDKIILKPQRFKIGNKILSRVVMKVTKKNYHILDVPYTCIVPNVSFYRYIFYWDSYFMFRGLLGTKRDWVIPEMVENFVYIFKKYHIIPNFSHPESLGRSQAPFLSTMIFDAYQVMKDEKKLSQQFKRLFISKKHWLKSRIAIAKQEYRDVWESPMKADHLHYNHKVTEYNLNRYGDRDMGYGHNAEQESGWDMTNRFYNRCDNFLPVDLNCFLYKYELDFAKAADILGEEKEKKFWEEKASDRKLLINKYMWNEKEGFYFDYDYAHKQQSNFFSLAGFVPLWIGIATLEQAQRVKEHFSQFHTKFGLAVTDKASLPLEVNLSSLKEPYRITIEDILKSKQWDYPNIWPPMHYLTVIGILRYGFIDDATKLIHEFLNANMQAFDKHHGMLEKMDGDTGDKPRKYWYPTQLGFGWTNAIFYRYTQLLETIKNKESLYKTSDISEPPYKFDILH